MFEEDNGRDRVLTDEEFRRLLDACRSQDLRDLVLLARYTAARRGELTGLRRKDVDLKRKLVSFIDTKNGTDRSVALVGPALEMLMRYQHLCEDSTRSVMERMAERFGGEQ